MNKMKKDKVILITGAGGKLKEHGLPGYELRKYATKHNMTFNYFNLDFHINQTKNNDTSYKLAKMFVLEQVYKNYDYVIWVDYDVRVNNYEDNIMDFINKKIFLNVCSHKICVPKTKRYYDVINSGMIVIKTKNKKKVESFIKEMKFLIKTTFNNTIWKDNAALLNMIGHEDVLKKFNFKVSWKFPESLTYNVLDNRFNHIPNVRGTKHGNINNAVFIHYAGMKNRDKYLSRRYV